MTHGTLVGAKLRTMTLTGLIVLCILAIGLYETSYAQYASHVQMVKTLFQSIVWEAFPFIVIGVALSALIDSFVGANGLSALLSDSLGGRLRASMLGMVLPVCDCGTIPVARTMRRKGVGESVVFTFALGTPTVNVVAIFSTFVAFHQQWSWVLWRAGGALLIAIFSGVIVRFGEDALTEKWETNALPRLKNRGFAVWRHVADHSAGELFAVGPFFVASALLAAVAQGLWPLHTVTGFTQHSVWSIFLLMGLGSVLSLCSEADAFVAASLTTLFSPGAVMAFMLAGQITDLRNLLLMPQVFSRRTVTVGLTTAFILIFACALLVNRVYTGGWA